MEIIRRIIIDVPETPPKGLVVCLPGRGIPISEMYRFALYSGLDKSLIAIIEPRGLEWYPQPFGAEDQKESVQGCKDAIKPLKKSISNICKSYKIPLSEVAVVGYSAGGVMALELAQNYKKELAIFISIAGTILDPENIKPAKNNTSILMKHCKDDDCFDWYERHEPARNGLLQNNYNLTLEEKNFGGHQLSSEDAHMIYRYISEKFEY